MLAKMTIKGLDEYAKKLSKLGSDAQKIAKKVVRAGANPIADEVRKGLEKNLQGSQYSEGDLMDSLGVTPVDVDRNGITNCKVGFEGYDRKGVPNALKARAMESGTSTQQKKPFIRPAVRRAKQKAIEEMGKTLDAEIKIYAL